MTEIFGFLNINKPLGLTSHDVVSRVRRLGGKSVKVGHAGTLDPLATGVLIVCLGAATRLSEYVMNSTKRYTARVRLGETTDTYDAEGEVIIRRDAQHVTREAVEAALPAFLGDIQQIPPMYSAIKQGGKKLYDLARKGETVERQPRAVHINSLTIGGWQPPEFDLEVVCSAGTYIRSLAYDLGEVLGVGAHLAGLVRTGSGTFTLENAVALDDLLQDPDWTRYLTLPEIALNDWLSVRLDQKSLDDIMHGRSIAANDVTTGTLARAVAPDGRFVAVLLAEQDRWLVHKCFRVAKHNKIAGEI
jgi:tRNA pseudouridine55 synthase